MNVIAIIIALFLSGFGFFLRKHPKLLMFVNTMSGRQKQEADQELLARLYGNGFFITGIITLLAYLGLKVADWELAAALSIIAVPIAGIYATVIVSFRHISFSKGDIIGLAIGLVITVMVFGGVTAVLGQSMQETTITATEEVITFSGKYGKTIPLNEIASVSIRESIPRIKIRTNGFALAGTLKGWFSVEEFGKTLIFRDRKKEGPYVVLITKDGKHIVFNTHSREEATSICLEVFPNLLSAATARSATKKTAKLQTGNKEIKAGAGNDPRNNDINYKT